MTPIIDFLAEEEKLGRLVTCVCCKQRTRCTYVEVEIDAYDTSPMLLCAECQERNASKIVVWDGCADEVEIEDGQGRLLFAERNVYLSELLQASKTIN